MSESFPDAHQIKKVRAMRVEDTEIPTIAVGVEDIEHEQFFFILTDAEAYDFIRRMTSALFDADPPRSGAGSPGAAVR